MNVEQKLNELEQELNELKQQTRNYMHKYWKPKIGEKFYYVEGTRIYVTEYDNSDFAKELVLTGNFFQTKEEAKKELKLRLATQRLKEAIWKANEEEFIGFVPDVLNITINVHNNILQVDYFTNTQTAQNWIYLKNTETAEKVLKENYKNFEIYYGLN